MAPIIRVRALMLMVFEAANARVAIRLDNMRDSTSVGRKRPVLSKPCGFTIVFVQLKLIRWLHQFVYFVMNQGFVYK